jgi:hypothetical protein
MAVITPVRIFFGLFLFLYFSGLAVLSPVPLPKVSRFHRP